MAYVNKGLKNKGFQKFLADANKFENDRASRGLTLPDSVDWRSLGYVTPIKDQGACGSCWAFSAVGSLEGQYFKTNRKLLSFSEQNFVDCTYGSTYDSCIGGRMDAAFDSIKSKGGIELNSTYPYTSGSYPPIII